MNQVAILTDFDGTVTVRDTNQAILDQFADPQAWRAIEERWARGEISTQDCYRQQFALIAADLEELVSFVHTHIKIDPAFRDFVAYCSSESLKLEVVSDGFELFITSILARECLHGIRYQCNDLRQRGTEWRFAFQQDRLSDYRNWKEVAVNDYKLAGYCTVFIGDGLSDRRAVQAANVSFVKKGSELDDWCRGTVIACERFISFHDVLSALPCVLATMVGSS
jgi:2,3-diketo-5-methylthio-1-phosphopentane phosphatase